MRRFPHQTARLSIGRHDSPAEGMCAMELSSLLADGAFSDRGVRACPAVAAFVRGYNDHIDDRRRQDLIQLAPDLVDSRAGEAVAEHRARRCLAFAAAAHRRRRLRLSPAFFAFEDRTEDVESAGRYAARAARRVPGLHEETLAFIRSLFGSPLRDGFVDAPVEVAIAAPLAGDLDDRRPVAL
jgi:hypothetical protein